MQELHTCIHTRIHAHIYFGVCVCVFTAGVPFFRSSFWQRYIYWKTSLNLNQKIQLKYIFIDLITDIFASISSALYAT